MTADQPSDPTEGPIPGTFRSSFSAFPDQHSSLPAEIGWQPRRDPPHTSANRSGDEEVPHTPSGDSSASIAPEGGATESGPDGPRRRRRGSRGGRRRRRGRAVGEGGEALPENALEQEPGLENPEVEPTDESLPSTDAAEAAPPGQANEQDGAPLGEGEPARRRRRRRGRGGRGRGAERAQDAPALPEGEEQESRPLERAPLRRPSSALPREIGIDVIPGEDGDLDVQPEAEVEVGADTHTAPRFEPEGEPAGDAFERKKRRRRGSRGGRNRKRRGPDESRSPVGRRAAPAAVFVESIPGEEDDLAELPAAPVVEPELAPDEEVAPRGPQGEPGRDGRRGRGRGRGRARGRGRRGESPELEAAPLEQADDDLDLEIQRAPALQRNQQILVNATDPEEKRVAVVENGQIVDFQMTVRTETSVVNDIYRGRVVNLEPAIGAAFVDFGQGRNGFLHTSDVLSVYGDPNWNLERLLTTRIDPQEWDSNSSQPKVGEELEHGEGGGEAGEGQEKPRRKERGGRAGRSFRARPRLPITDLLKKGQMVCVQVTKDAIGDKGPTLTTYISIPGRYLVLMPSMSRTGVSRKIEDEKERRRLKRILEQMDVPQGMGVIVRTAGVGRSKADLQRDLDYLMGVWETFSKRLRAGHGPAPLYQESDIAIRTVRDLATQQTEAIIVDDVEVHRQIVEFAHKLMPEDEARVQLHTGPKPLFHSFGIEPDFERMFARRIDLPSGGSIVFDQAEALVAIDVNSGRTRTDSFDFEQIALKTNLEAAPVIARQIRLRDLGGIIVVDFIDMMKTGSMRTVERKFRESLAQDRARFKIGRISQFGLLELTRQRLGPGIDKKVFHTCARCRGTGHIRTVESRAAAILRRLGSALNLKGFSTVEVRAHPEVVDYLKGQCSEYLRALEYRCERQIRLIEATDQAEDSVLRYLRTDGREVRPGGRRKR